MSILKKVVASLTGENQEEKQPVQLFRRNGLYFKTVPSKGLGVFCKEDIKAGEVIEVSPLFIFNEADSGYIPRMLLWDYVFSLKDERISPGLMERLQIKDQSKANCIAMGISSFCNHLVDPNAGMEWIEDDLSAFSVLKANKDIPAGAEICINYGIAWLALHKKM